MYRLRSVLRVSGFFSTVLLLWSCIASGGEPTEATARADAAERDGATAAVSVLYLTNRKRQEGKPASETYNGERGEPHFGRCEVEFSPIPMVDRVAAKMPFYVKTETNEITHAGQVAAPSFWKRLREALARTSSGSVVLFVHGYNYGFERTCRMAAEVQRSLRDKAVVVVFSWPSDAAASDYVSDLADVEWSAPLLARFIAQLGDRIGNANVQVVAHSLGSRGVIFALQRLGARQPKQPVVGRLVLLAPDFDSQTFVDLLPELTPLAADITLYASDNDAPLKLSRQLSGYPRLGEAGEYLTVAEGMDTIDVSSTGRYQISGHEYFYFNPAVVADLVALLGAGVGPGERPGLKPKMRDGVRYWGIVEPD